MTEYGEGVRIKRAKGRFRGKRQVIIGTRKPTNERTDAHKREEDQNFETCWD